ncbi:hypothetical protein EJ08DRAFT_658612 [Tothia fuscella]|uniref:Uncharacterized protein n=1 Tax=Tothia fuscella TaxID=1048955 RepID=A0A9P4NWJ1_9PEZI|nr:hypothetical protein EJ08DRAFT_658612 [Tothia fuscella]
MTGTKLVPESGAATLKKSLDNSIQPKTAGLTSKLEYPAFGIKFRVQGLDDTRFETDTHGQTFFDFERRFNRCEKEHYLHCTPTVVIINRSYYDFAIQTFEKAPRFSQQAFLVEFALVLAHEMAHAVYRTFHPDLEMGEINTEALHSGHESVSEMGRSWESWLLGSTNKCLWFHSIGTPFGWWLQELSPERSEYCGMKHLDMQSGIPINIHTAQGNSRMDTMLKLLDSITWEDIAVKRPTWFVEEQVFLPSALERRQLLEDFVGSRRLTSPPGADFKIESSDVELLLYDENQDFSILPMEMLPPYLQTANSWFAEQGIDIKTTAGPLRMQNTNSTSWEMSSRSRCEICGRQRQHMISCDSCGTPIRCGVACYWLTNSLISDFCWKSCFEMSSKGQTWDDAIREMLGDSVHVFTRH